MVAALNKLKVFSSFAGYFLQLAMTKGVEALTNQARRRKEQKVKKLASVDVVEE